MLIAIDYDGTWTRAPEFFRAMVLNGPSYGLSFVLVTGRGDEGQWGREVRDAIGGLVPIVFANNGWKRDAAERAGYKVDVWIDDRPEGIDRLEPAVIAKRDEYTREGLVKA